ncbi:NAD(P)-binding protein [Aneurinibacillus aneurinilyticus]|jgi:electron transfer flavoprotein-quinone oxidoreductase|uniref:NAD(P)-binding protein n=2 Tax=Aneurinibacillus aneurinilyticus TaxID=1391 RepID=A0A848CX14_ANEAE|nr:NAD(P)-binding protein [Aneurinibacillus aneurinilyticus]ERI10500.1 FAD dependent oxidoreductase [Aneurinibacillus aneurinilyticus ATCC 12856]MCI1693750.1 NAD(P)-binding protein [Aneurinibacillus aneurinilyticus]MED0669505.1 NAD(P)-binding protein [Aneurinibacillus aneurinilyticus]MED0709073.1 NAD(P)-binding protein [Aneurinibacillus aneurinilyticus]MED0725467.1 NAD(P)-binding protein [Aneurinibacillus aneurinilyticus]
MQDTYDAIVVGAGPSGSVAAYMMARGGLKVLLLERGPHPGSKNMFGGTIYALPTADIFPEFWKDAPWERFVTTEYLYFLDDDSAFQIGFTNMVYGKPPYNKVVVHRGVFDRWVAQKAVNEGAVLQTNALVTNLIYEKSLFGRDKVQGVQLDNGCIYYADAVILCEGINSFLTKQAGLRTDIPAETVKLYAKQVFRLPRSILEDRFHLEGDEGAIYAFTGYPTAGVIGKAGIWTGKETLALITGGFLDQLAEKRMSPYELLERTKRHPLIRRLLKDAEPIEYAAHMIPKGGFKMIPQLYDHHLLIAGDAATMVSGRRGTDLAMLSGKMAGETILQAHAKGDFSQKILSNYGWKINQSFFMTDIRKKRGTDKYVAKYQDSDYLISRAMNEFGSEFFHVGMGTEQDKMKKIQQELKQIQLPLKSFEDVWQALRHWEVL